MATIKIKPLNGLIVRDPETREPLKAGGEEKPRNPYWLRRLKEKSVELVIEDKTKTAKKTVATKEADQ